MKCQVAAFDGVVGVEDQDAVCGRIEQRIEALLFVGDLSVELGVVDSNGGLVGKGLQKSPVVGGEQVRVVAEDEDDADQLSVRGERQTDTVEQSFAGGVGQAFEHTVEFAHIQFADFFLGQQGGEIAQKSGSNSMGGGDAPAVLLL